MEYDPKIHKSKLEVTPWVLDKANNVVIFTLKNLYGTFNVKVDKEDWDRIVENNRVPEIMPKYKKGKVTDYFRVRIADKGKPKLPKGTNRKTFLHRWILGEDNIPQGLQVDHINGDPLDNRRANLRTCTNLENQMNRTNKFNKHSKYMGVSYNNNGGKRRSTGTRRCLSKPWKATITLVEGTKTRLGTFKTELEAAEAWDIAAYKHFMDYAKLNFPENIEKYKNLTKS